MMFEGSKHVKAVPDPAEQAHGLSSAKISSYLLMRWQHVARYVQTSGVGTLRPLLK